MEHSLAVITLVALITWSAGGVGIKSTAFQLRNGESAVSKTAARSATLLAANVSLGKNLQASASVNLSEPAPATGAQITLRSNNPHRLLLSLRPDTAGSSSIQLSVPPHFRASPEFWLQALDNQGTEVYTASAPGYGESQGIVTLCRSGFVIVGPLRTPVFQTTTGAAPSPIHVYSARLDSSLLFVEEQSLAAGFTSVITVASANPALGSIVSSPVVVRGGVSAAVTRFKPAAAGETAITVTAPAGFDSPAQMKSVTAVISKPKLAVTSLMRLGHNLEMPGVLNLGEAPPATGIAVTLKSSDPAKLVLSPKSNQVGSESITIRVAQDTNTAMFYLQALTSSGTVTYTASAPGYDSGTGTITLTPSGVLITPALYGPPDEAELTRDVRRGVVMDLSREKDLSLAVWTAQLDPDTGRGADVTVQALRPGLSVSVEVSNGNASVGTVASPVTIAAHSDHAVTRFTAFSPGRTSVYVSTPAGFATPANSTSVPIEVQ